MTNQFIELEMAFCSDYCEWEATISATVTTDLAAKIDAMQTLILATDYMRSIDIEVSSDFLSDETEALLQDQCRFDICQLTVFAWGFVFCLQGKYDSHIQAEYTVV